MLDFKSEPERQQWIIAHAHLFTIVRFKKRQYERHEAETLMEARIKARELIQKTEGSRWMIYAVAKYNGVDIDTFVETVAS